MSSHNEPLKSGDWFPPLAERPGPSRLGVFLQLIIGVAVGLLILVAHSRNVGVLILAIVVTTSIARLSSRTFLEASDQWLARLGHWIGLVVGTLTLAPLFLIGFSIVRLCFRIVGHDPLQLRNSGSRSFWLPCDTTLRKNRHIHSTFATETVSARKGLSWFSLFILGFALLLAGELLLRSLGFGNAVLYVHDELAGFYPAPNQNVTRFGGTVATNDLGMRGPTYPRQKSGNTIRILMLGDSTLYGGQYVDQPLLYARQLEDILQQAASKRQVQVFNMGVNGWGPFNKLGYVRNLGVFDADLCLICLPLDDLRRPLVHMWDTPYFRASAPPRLAYEEVLHHLNWRQRTRALPKRNQREINQQVELGIKAYQELASEIREAGCEVMFEVLPSRAAGLSHVIPDKESRRFQEFEHVIRKDGFEIRFPVGLFHAKGDPEELYHDPLHLDVKGHAVYAEHLARGVMETDAWQRFNSAP